MSEKPLTPWVVCEKSGKVLSAHCDCMAGLGESCSHVASLLWAMEAGCKRRDSLTVTEKKAYWVLPSAVKSVPYARVKDIQFSKTPLQLQQSSHQLLLPPQRLNQLISSVPSRTVIRNLHCCLSSLLIQILIYLSLCIQNYQLYYLICLTIALLMLTIPLYCKKQKKHLNSLR